MSSSTQWSWRRSLAALLLIGAALPGPAPAGATVAQMPRDATAVAARWVATGTMPSGLQSQGAVRLPNGEVLVAGGDTNGSDAATAELYSPGTGTWIATGSMSTYRLGPLTLLRNGKVLVSGGWTQLTSAELYDPATGTWAPTGSMGVARQFHTATLLPSGLVLIAGGDSRGSAELYDPATGIWRPTGSMTTPRMGDTATLLPNGTVLVTGGCGAVVHGACSVLASAELYDPANGSWTLTGSMTERRESHTATLLPSGLVLVAGGCSVNIFSCIPTAGAELYDPRSGTWSSTGRMVTRREYHTATLLSDGRVLVAGGFDNGSGGALASAELYDPAAGTWRATAAMHNARFWHTATLLRSGRVLAAGGTDGYQTLSGAELFAAR